MRPNSPLKSARILRPLARPGVTEFDARDSLRANPESSGDVLLSLPACYRFADKPVALVEGRNSCAPFVAPGEHRLCCPPFDDQVRQGHPQECLTIGSVRDDQHMALSPMRLLDLRPNGSKAKTVAHPLQHDALAVGENDAQTTLGRRRHPPFAIGEAGHVGGKLDIGPVSHPSSIAILAVAIAVPVAEWITHRLVAAEGTAESDAA